MTEGKMSLEQVSKELRRLASDGMFGIMADAIDTHLASQSTNPYERAVIEQAMVTECVNIEGRDPTDIIRDIISWHVGMDRGVRNAEKPGGCGCPCEPSGSDGLRCPGSAGKLLCDITSRVEQPKAATDAQVVGYLSAKNMDHLKCGNRNDWRCCGIASSPTPEQNISVYTHPAPSQAVDDGNAGQKYEARELLEVADELDDGEFWKAAEMLRYFANPSPLAYPAADQAVATARDGVTEDLRILTLTAVKRKWSYDDLARFDRIHAALASPSAPRVGVMDEVIKAAAVECARRAYGYWKGDSTGGSSAIEYFDRNRGLGGIQYTIEMMEGCIRNAMLAAAPESGGV